MRFVLRKNFLLKNLEVLLINCSTSLCQFVYLYDQKGDWLTRFKDVTHDEKNMFFNRLSDIHAIAIRNPLHKHLK